MGGKNGGTQTVTEKSDPWEGIQPFLLGTPGTRQLRPGVQPTYSQGSAPTGLNPAGLPWQPGQPGYEQQFGGQQNNPDSDYHITGGTPGIYPEAQNLYSRSGTVRDQQANVNDMRMAQLDARNSGGYYDAIIKSGKDTAGGYFSPQINSVASVAGADQITPGNVRAGHVDLTSARQNQGALDPTSSMQSLLGGQVNNPYLRDTANAVTNQIGRNYSENVMPGIRSGAVGSGQYGGSRQGLAEGLALSRMNQDVAQAVAPIYSGAHENAQNRMMQTAGQLNNQAQNNMTGNVNRQFQADNINVGNDLQSQLANQQANMKTDQFNAGLGLQNNQQEMQRAAQDVNTRMQGLNALGMGQQFQDQNYQNALNTFQQPNNYDWDQLNRYASIVTPGAGIGGSSTSSQPTSSNPIAGLLGGGLAAGGLGASLGGAGLAGPWGLAAGAGLGLLGGMF